MVNAPRISAHLGQRRGFSTNNDEEAKDPNAAESQVEAVKEEPSEEGQVLFYDKQGQPFRGSFQNQSTMPAVIAREDPRDQPAHQREQRGQHGSKKTL